MRRSHTRGIGLILLCTSALAANLTVGNFSQGDLSGWEEESFVGHTDYALVNHSEGTVLRARTDASASGLFLELDVDLSKTPYLNWSWKVDSVYQGNDEHSKQGDDYPARVYVVVSGGLFFWKTRAINYVWSSHQPVGATWDNAYTGNARMIAVQSGTEKTGQWVMQRRNVREDFKRLFGEEIDEINAVAVMSDSDNTGQRATAWYGDIYFTP